MRFVRHPASTMVCEWQSSFSASNVMWNPTHLTRICALCRWPSHVTTPPSAKWLTCVRDAQVMVHTHGTSRACVCVVGRDASCVCVGVCRACWCVLVRGVLVMSTVCPFCLLYTSPSPRDAHES
eukprot:767319-Prymnesium_polylepis.1